MTDKLEQIFWPFEQVGDKRLQTEGTGLGLSISHHMVQMMGGTLEVTSQPGKGSTFWFELELLDLPDWAEIAKRGEQIVGYRGDPRTILVIDDNEQNREVLVNLLSPLGFEVIQAGDGEEGVITAQKILPDVILVDLILPGIDGLDVTRQIRQTPPQTGRGQVD